MNIDDNDYRRPLMTPEGALALGYLLGAWLTFKKSHDLKSEKLQCCEKSKQLFEALDEYEKLMMGK